MTARGRHLVIVAVAVLLFPTAVASQALSGQDTACHITEPNGLMPPTAS